MTTRLQVITDAAHQIGKGEHPDGSNCTEFGVSYGWNCVAWCDVFCSVILTRNGIPYHQASVGVSVEQARRQGRFAAEPAGPGDLITFDWNGDGWGDHIGIVEKVLAPGRYQTIEGNTDNMVARRTRTQSILGFILVPYPATEGDWLEMATKEDVKAAVREVLAEVLPAQFKNLNIDDVEKAAQIVRYSMAGTDADAARFAGRQRSLWNLVEEVAAK